MFFLLFFELKCFRKIEKKKLSNYWITFVWHVWNEYFNLMKFKCNFIGSVFFHCIVCEVRSKDWENCMNEDWSNYWLKYIYNLFGNVVSPLLELSISFTSHRSHANCCAHIQSMSEDKRIGFFITYSYKKSYFFVLSHQLTNSQAQKKHSKAYLMWVIQQKHIANKE